MALATVCPHCNKKFRVASDQLKLRGGIVRCGACNQVFDGNAALIDLDNPAVPVSPPPPPSDAASDVVSATSASADFDTEVAAIDAQLRARGAAPRQSLDFDAIYDPLGIAPEPEAAPMAAPRLQIDEEIVGFALRDDLHDQHDLHERHERHEQHERHDLHDKHDKHDKHDPPDRRSATPLEPSGAPLASQPERRHPALPMRASAVAVFVPLPAPASALPVALARTARRNAAKRHKASAAAALAAAQANEPEFVTRSRLQAQTGPWRRMAMGAVSVLLVLVLVAQGLGTFRNVLAVRLPQWKPVLEAGCAVFGCRVELPAQIDALSIETGELQALSANRFSYATLLRNQGSLPQAWPHLELVLTDANDKALVRRVFAPADYLPPGVPAATGLGPRSEQAVKLFFELNQLKASGYHIAIFYP